MTAIRRIALVGLPGSGKSSVASALAQRLGWRCVDIDTEVAARSGRPAASIIAEDGEPVFRELEQAALERALRDVDPAVIACGGGLMTQDTARRMILDSALVVWLDAPDTVLLQRLGNGTGRPLLHGSPRERLAELRAERQSTYATAHVRVAAAGGVEDVAGRVAGAAETAIRVAIPGRAYHVEVRHGALTDIPIHLPSGTTRVALVADRAASSAARSLTTALRKSGYAVAVINVTGGEALKTWAAAGRLLSRLSGAGLRRHDCVVALGGGSVGDLAGFAAATYLRGIAWINAPTTLLAMVDSAVGGKTGVNLPRGKNLAGAFWQPRAVVCDPSLLHGLPERAYRSALAEIVKYAMVRDGRLVTLLDDSLTPLLARDPDLLVDTVRACCAIKAEIVAADERDSGVRAILNYGHTAGHAIEAAAGFGGDPSHGEAIAAGMRIAGLLSVRRLGCPAADIQWQQNKLARCGFAEVATVDRARVVEHITQDKKAVGEQVGWVLLERRGSPRFGQVVPEHEVGAVLDEVLRP